MKIFPILFILGILPTKPSVSLKSFHMGMTYFLVPDKKSSCSDNFPDGLSYFFEQIGGFDEKAEVAQVSRVLQIDLSIFQDVEYNYEDEAEIKKHWHNLPVFASIVKGSPRSAEAVGGNPVFPMIIQNPPPLLVLYFNLRNLTPQKFRILSSHESWINL